MMRTDEIFALLPEAGLQLWILADNGDEGWYCVLNKRGSVPDNDKAPGRGPGPLEALVGACGAWGVNVEDDGT